LWPNHSEVSRVSHGEAASAPSPLRSDPNRGRSAPFGVTGEKARAAEGPGG
jgi:hypothetical protein